MTTALITGVTGQDGHYLAELLSSEGADVHGWIHEESPETDAARREQPWLTLHQGALDDAERVASVINRVKPNEVYHLAAVSSVAQSWRQPSSTWRTNSLTTVTLLEAVREHSTDTRFVHASSAEIFGGAAPPQTEVTAIAPTSPYGASKAGAHLLTRVFRRDGLHASNVVLFNHESPRRPAHFVTQKIIRAAVDIAAGRIDHVDLGNMSARRDWGWAPEYAVAMVAAARHPEPDDFVIASGEAHSVEEFAARAFERVGLHWRDHVRQDPTLFRPTDSSEQRGDASKAKAELAWEATVRFDEVVERLIRAYSSSTRG